MENKNEGMMTWKQKENIFRPLPPPSFDGILGRLNRNPSKFNPRVLHVRRRSYASDRTDRRGTRDSENNRISSLPPAGNIAMRARAIGERIAAGTMTISAVARSGVLGRSVPSRPPPHAAHRSPSRAAS